MLRLLVLCGKMIVKRSHKSSFLMSYFLNISLLLSCLTSVYCNEKPTIDDSAGGERDGAEDRRSETHIISETGDAEQDSVLTEDVNKPSQEESQFSGNKLELEDKIKPLVLYRHLLRDKRRSHRQAIKALLGIDKYEKKYSMLKLMLEKMFLTTKDAKVVLMESGYTPGDPFPADNKLRDVLSMVIENTMFFGDMLLHLPDIIHDLLKRNNEWSLMARWGISFSNDTRIYEESELKLLSLMAQELGIIEKDPNYVNPYRAEQRDLKKEIEKLMKDSANEATSQNKQKKKKRRKNNGPRLSSRLHNEL